MPKMKWTAALRRRAASVAERGCMICEVPGQLHHEFSLARGEIKRHDRIVCLCLRHHQRPFPESRHQLGRDGFDEFHGVDIAAEAGWDKGLVDFLEKLASNEEADDG